MDDPPAVVNGELAPSAPLFAQLSLGATFHRAAAAFVRLAGCSHRKLHFQLDLTTTAGQTVTVTSTHPCRR